MVLFAIGDGLARRPFLGVSVLLATPDVLVVVVAVGVETVLIDEASHFIVLTSIDEIFNDGASLLMVERSSR